MFSKTIAEVNGQEVNVECEQFMGSAPLEMRGLLGLSASFKSEDANVSHGIGKRGITKSELVSLRDSLTKIIEQV